MTKTTEIVFPLHKCEECDRVFDLLGEEDADEYWHGHDCEASK